MLRHIGAISNQPRLAELAPRIRRPSPRETIAAPDELTKLLTAAQPWMSVLVLLGAHAGLRISDAMRVCPAHRNADARTITIEQKKNGHPVTLPLTDQLKDMLDKAPDGPQTTPYYALFRQGMKRETVAKSGFAHAWQRLKKKAGVNPDLWFHDLRRTIAVSLYEISKDLRVAEQMLGHKSLSSTLQYLEHRDPAKLRPYLQALFTPKGPVQ